MDEDKNQNQISEVKHTVAIPGEWALKKVLGPTLDEIGQDLSVLYKKGRDKITSSAERKIKPGTEGQRANLRVAWNVFTSGSFSDSAISAEYFGGILASSKSEDGNDDAGIYYFDIVKSLSSTQLHLHYVLYRSLNNLMADDPTSINKNLGLQNDISSIHTYFFSKEMTEIGLNLDTDFVALHSKGLLSGFEVQRKTVKDPKNREENIDVDYVSFTPTSLGFQLYAMAHNELKKWRSLCREKYQDFPEIKYPSLFGNNLEKLVIRAIGINSISIEIDRPTATVFAFTIDPNNTPKWIQSIKEEKINSLPVLIGAIYENTKDGINWTRYKCVEFKENELFTLECQPGTYFVRYKYEQITENKMKLTYTEWDTSGNLVEPFDISVLQKLKQEIESMPLLA
ncbi:MAG: hypothetical protein MUF50_01950 [Planctomycetes bacterium]|jgi:hypothetical protein|nr:hypothetical protein [Planctomycetota bacterium]